MDRGRSECNPFDPFSFRISQYSNGDTIVSYHHGVMGSSSCRVLFDALQTSFPSPVYQSFVELVWHAKELPGLYRPWL